MRTNIKILTTTLLLGFSAVSFAQTGSNTYPYPSLGKVGIGTTTLLNYNLTTASDLFYKAIPGEEGSTYESGIVPFRILAQDYNPETPIIEEASNVEFLSEARIYDFGQPASTNTRVYGLKRDGSMLLGKWANSTAHSFAYSLVTDNSIYTKNNLYVESKIGLGTTSPQASIDLKNGDMALNDNKLLLRAGGDPFRYLSYVSLLNGNSIDGPSLVGYEGGVLGTSSGSTKGILYWNKDGRVGINTSSPTQALEVNGKVKFAGTNTDDEIVFEPNNGFHRIVFSELRFHELGIGDKLVITDGKVGIGTINPSEALEVNGNIKLTAAASNNALVIENSSINSIDFLVKGDGHVYAREIDVQLGTFPDYVFDDKYELMSLSSLKKYIDEENHLPGVKSAEEVKNEGIGLGELSRIQMEKIEELTLYILQQDEKLKELEERLKKLEK
ncbi:MAG: hypothetical protein JKY48_13795 [Flavobacteriales bacterium]|nr:hypothetical protein [Flavobacteriales bacterium]